jgi:hypothetical protein
MPPPARLAPADALTGIRLSGPPADIFSRFAPPFHLVSDMLFAAAFCPTAPLERAFPGRPFLRLGDRTPLVMWFSRVKAGTYTGPDGARAHLGEGAGLYNELTVLALLHGPAVFVPGIYLTSALSARVGWRYGMPKQPAVMGFQAAGTQVRASVYCGDHHSFAVAHALGGGRALGRLAAHFWPWWTWPAYFPDGRFVRGEITATPRIRPAWVQAGQLALPAAWLPAPVPLLPLGCYLPDQAMVLPPPGE